jgi:hypothetical protein
MQNAAKNGEVFSYHFKGHADNVRGLKVFINAPKKNTQSFFEYFPFILTYMYVFMKSKYLIIIGLLFCNNIYSQDNIINQIKEFVAKADMNCYIDNAQKNIIDDYELRCKEIKKFYISLYDSINLLSSTILPPPPQIDLHKVNTVPMLAIQFINTENFNYGDNIYDYIAIDSTIVFTFACVDKKMNVYAFANYIDGIYPYQDAKQFKQKHRQVIKNINKQQPELLLSCSSLAVYCIGCDTGYYGYLYLKNGKIYVYRPYNTDIIELNDYIHGLSLNTIRNLNMVPVPRIYGGGIGTMRRTGNTLTDEIQICPCLVLK